MDKPVINASYDFRRFFIYQKAVFIVGVFLVAVCGKCSDKLAALPLHFERLSDFFGSGGGKLLVEHSPDRHFKAACRMWVCVGVDEWCACADKPCPVDWNKFLKKLLLICKVAETACK